ncbi:MAG: DUF1761 family protein [Paracoccaceae bacterium]
MTEFANVNWAAVLLGAAAAFGAGFLWYGPVFGKAWARGSHGITAPQKPPLAALALNLAGIVLLAVVVGVTATTDALLTALAAILAAAALVLSGSLFSQKSTAAALIDGGFVVAAGALMIVAQGIL